MTSRIDTIGQNGNEGIHYDHVGESYADKIKRITGDKEMEQPAFLYLPEPEKPKVQFTGRWMVELDEYRTIHKGFHSRSMYRSCVLYLEVIYSKREEILSSEGITFYDYEEVCEFVPDYSLGEIQCCRS